MGSHVHRSVYVMEGQYTDRFTLGNGRPLPSRPVQDQPCATLGVDAGCAMHAVRLSGYAQFTSVPLARVTGKLVVRVRH